MNNLKLLKICSVLSYLQILYLIPLILHLVIGVPPSNLCSTISYSRKFDLPPPLLPAWEGVHAQFLKHLMPTSLLESEEISRPLKQGITALSVLNLKSPSFVLASRGFWAFLLCSLLLSASAWKEVAILIYSWDHIAPWAGALYREVTWFHECPFSSSILCWTQQASSSCLCVCLGKCVWEAATDPSIPALPTRELRFGVGA